MKLKKLEQPAVQAWSPASQYPVCLATGTSAQQLDASFNTSGTLEIFEVDFRDPSLELKCKGVLPASSRFHKLIWGSFGNGLLEGSGVIAGGGDNGMLTLYNVTHILSSGKEPVIAQRQKHTGAVRALDFNPFQGNLLASGASDSEIFIWDLNNMSVPMMPGSKSQPPEDIRALSWNRQVQHILSSAHPSGKAVVWDLRKNEPIIKVSDHSNRMHCSGLAWHPDIATQLLLCSEDDRLPVVQLWDLRFASSPLKVLESHSRGILSMSWSQADAELLLSSAKDNQILCWNLESSEVVYRLTTQGSWSLDVQWCPRLPPLFSAASLDGWISVFSVMGGNWEAQHMSQADKISSSFSKGQPFMLMQVPEQVAQASLIPPLKKPPKWIRRPAGVSFAFGGRLVTFGLPNTPAHQVPQPCPRLVFISQVTTELEFLTRSVELQEALGSGKLLDYCQNKSHQASLQDEKMLWQFLKVTLEPDSRAKFLKLLGYSKGELKKKVATWLKSDLAQGDSPQTEEEELGSNRKQAFYPKAAKPPMEESSTSSAFFDELVLQNMTPWEIPTTEDADGLLSQAILLGELGPAVELCLKEERFADAIILAQAGSAELLKQTQERYLAQKKSGITSLLACVVRKSWKDMVCACSLKNWREALVLLLTYSRPETFSELCDMLGSRMEQEGGRTLTSEARLCYVCSGSVERLVECWAKCHWASSPLALQELMEKVMILNRSLELLRGPAGVSPGPATTCRVIQYANLLAAQGSLATAMNFLPVNCAQPAVQQLRDRLFHAQGSAVSGQSPPPFPFPRVVVRTTRPFKETPSYGLDGQPPHQTLCPRPKAIPPSPPVLPLTPACPSPDQSPRTQTVSDNRTPGPRVAQSLPLGPGGRPAVSQPQLLGGHGAQAPNPVGLPGTWPLPGPPPPMAAPDIQPGSTCLLGAQRPSLLPPVRPPASSSQSLQPPTFPSTFPVTCPPGGPGAPCPSTFPTAGTLTSLPGSQGFQRDAAAPRVNLWGVKLPETFMAPTPITVPVLSLAPQPPASGVRHAPPGAPGELTPQHLQQLPPMSMCRKKLPPEHQPLKTSFEALLHRCSLSATDLKTKRKLAEAAQRLECLYEKLYVGSLSPQVLAGLHEVARCVDTGHLEQALAVHTQVVCCSSFSEVSSFMPILKAVLTIAQKLRV
ncbi:protein transport protein Sec31B [Ochotona princeps]|uniref:protein transport protein Sec31B n=1 Tax=Ochotona princeps TaxID=9978 RepID=UPI002714A490|nr:protein transport protein Sec31B [Ochotona princeps]